MDGLLLALRVVGVNLGRLGVTGRLTTAEALATVHGGLGHAELGRHHRGHEGRGEREAKGDEEEAEHLRGQGGAGWSVLSMASVRLARVGARAAAARRAGRGRGQVRRGVVQAHAAGGRRAPPHGWR